MRTITTDIINKIVQKHYNGEKITRKNNIFYQGQIGTINSKFIFSHTFYELSEYVKCSNSIEYFIETYLCIKLRNYQKEWIKTFNVNKFIISMSSRQCGINTIYSAILLHYMIFNSNKTISIISYKSYSSFEFIDLVYKWYLKLPYFLKPSLLSKNIKNIKFNNNNIIKRLNKYEKSDIVFYIDFAFIPDNILNKTYINYLTCISSIESGKLILTSVPNGNNLFTKLVQNSERKEGDPLKNLFITNRTYWWEVDGRDDLWKEEKIKELGSEELFNQEYDLKFIK